MKIGNYIGIGRQRTGAGSTVPYYSDALVNFKSASSAGVLSDAKGGASANYYGEVMKFVAAANSYIALPTDPSGEEKYRCGCYYLPDGTQGHYMFNHYTDDDNRIALMVDSLNELVYCYVCDGSLSYGRFDYSVVGWTDIRKLEMIFDGSQADNATRLILKIDDVQVTLEFDGTTIPAALPPGLTTHTIGEKGGACANGIGYDFNETIDEGNPASETNLRYLWNHYDVSGEDNHGTPSNMDYDWLKNVLHKPTYGVVRWANKTTGAIIDVPYQDESGTALSIDLTATHNKIWEAAPAEYEGGYKIANCRDLVDFSASGIDQTDLSNDTYFVQNITTNYDWYDAGAVDRWSVESLLIFMLSSTRQPDKFYMNVTLNGSDYPTHMWNFALYETAKTKEEQILIATEGGWLDVYNDFTFCTADGTVVLSMIFLFPVGKTIVADWGDGSTTSYNGNDAVIVNMGHTYLRQGIYNIRLKGDYSSLTYLYCTNFALTGDVSGWSALTSLTYLRCNDNSLTGDVGGWSALTSLTSLYCNDNSLTGDVSGWSALISLTYLYCYFNSLTYNTALLPASWDICNIKFNYNRWITAMVDQFLIDLDAVSVASVKSLYLAGTNQPHTPAPSLAHTALLSLRAKGWTVDVN